MVFVKVFIAVIVVSDDGGKGVVGGGGCGGGVGVMVAVLVLVCVHTHMWAYILWYASRCQRTKLKS